MSTLKEDLQSQRQDYEDELKETREALREADAMPSATISPELLTLDMQKQASLAHLELSINQKNKDLRYSASRCAYYIPTPYGKITAESANYDSDFVDIANSYPNDKVGHKYLKEHKIKTKDPKLPQEIANYFAYQYITSYIEQQKNNIPAKEYKDSHEDATFALQNSIKSLNQKGFFVNPQTGDLEYNNPALQKAWDLAQNR